MHFVHKEYKFYLQKYFISSSFCSLILNKESNFICKIPTQICYLVNEINVYFTIRMFFVYSIRFYLSFRSQDYMKKVLFICNI